MLDTHTRAEDYSKRSEQTDLYELYIQKGIKIQRLLRRKVFSEGQSGMLSYDKECLFREKREKERGSFVFCFWFVWLFLNKFMIKFLLNVLQFNETIFN